MVEVGELRAGRECDAMGLMRLGEWGRGLERVSAVMLDAREKGADVERGAECAEVSGGFVGRALDAVCAVDDSVKRCAECAAGCAEASGV